MEKKQKLTTFKEIIKSLSEATRKNISKKHPKYKEIYDQSKEIIDLVSSETYTSINADAYTYYIINIINISDSNSINLKLIETVIDNITRLFNEEFFDLSKIVEKNEKNDKKKNIVNLNITLLDILLDAIVKLINTNDESIWMLISRLFVVILVEKSGKYKVYHETLMKIIRFHVKIYLSMKKLNFLENIKANLREVVIEIYKDNEILNMNTFNHLLNNFRIENDISRSSYVAVIKSPIERLVTKMLMQSVDDVCLFYAKAEEEDVFENFNKQKTNLNLPIIENPINFNQNDQEDTSLTDIKEDEGNEESFINKLLLSNKNKQKNKQFFTSFLSSNTTKSTNSFLVKLNFHEETLTNNIGINIPLRCVPYTYEDILQNPKYFHIKNPHIRNENEEESGSFGWCCICRKGAEFYCKSTRAPVCSLKCRNRLLKEEEILEKYMKGEVVLEENYAISRLVDTISIFKAVSNLQTIQISSNVESINQRGKILSLEMLHYIIDRPGVVITNLKEIVLIIKDDIMGSIVRNCLSEEVNLQLFQLSISLFFKIWSTFRQSIKLQISIFIEKVLLRILNSENSSYSLKLIVMDEFYKISGVPRFYIELFVNYDCDLEEKDLLNRIINTLCKIGQGRFTKFEYLNKEEEYNLRRKAVETITLFVQSLFHMAQDQTSLNMKVIEEMKSISINQQLDEDEYSTYHNNNHSNNHSNNQSYNDNSSTPSQISNDFNQKLDESKRMKNEIKSAVEKFNVKPKNGILHLKKVGFFKSNSEEHVDIAFFLKNADGLNKSLIGDYIGENLDLNIKVLDSFSSIFDFKGRSIIDSIRYFLSTFKLPGEAQKIDRIMQRFANKYSLDNPKEYKNADLAYYISFAIIMIQTEIHNPHVKNKRGLKGFIDMCRQFGTAEDLSDTYLEGIYKDIELRPISMVEIEEMKERVSFENQADIYKLEVKRMYEESSAQLKSGKNKTYLKICEVEHIEPMINSIWSSLLALYSLNLEDNDDWNINYYCIEGLGGSIKLCSLLGLTMLRDAFVKCLIKSTYLLQGKELKEKHISCLKTILSIAQQEIRLFYGSWRVLLLCISSVEFYHMAISGSKNDMEIFMNELKSKKRTENEIKIERQNLVKISEITSDDYDFIFIESIKLEEDSFLEFVKALCEVSKEEISNNTPRLFSLQKLVEVADINMDRIQIQWFKIWKIISDFLVEMGSNQSTFIAEKAVDSLRQLANKFLKKGELAMYHFQKEFLHPFELIYRNNKDVYKIKEFVLTCITMIVIQQIKSIKSGWIVIFSLFSLASEDSSLDIVKKGFDTMYTIFNNYIENVMDVYSELVSCFCKFSHYFPDLIINKLNETQAYLIEPNQIHALLVNMGRISISDKEIIRKDGVSSVMSIVNNLSYKFEKVYWKEFFYEVVINILIVYKENKYCSSLEYLFNEINNMYMKYSTYIGEFLIDYMEEIVDTIVNENESVALIGLDSFKNIIFQLSKLDFQGKNLENNLNSKANPFFWTIIISSLIDLFNKTSQVEMLSLEIEKIDQVEYQQVYKEIVYKNIVFSIIQHNLIEISEDILINHDINLYSKDQCILILKSLKESFLLAYDFNCEFRLRKKISSQFMSDLEQVAALFKQQQDGVKLYFKVLLRIINESLYDKAFKDSCRDQVIIDCVSLLNQFADRVNYYSDDGELNIENERLINNMYPIVLDDIIFTLEELDYINEREEVVSSIFSVLINCVPCNILEIRLKLREVMERIFTCRKLKLN